MTINKYAYVSLEQRDDSLIEAHSLDYGTSVTYNAGQEPPFDGNLDLLKAVTKRLAVQTGLTAYSHCDAPPGSGLGSSSAMVVAYVGALARMLQLPVTSYEIARLAVQVERVDLQIAGGYQDQYACTFGGWNYVEFIGDLVVVNPLRISADTLNELEYSLVLVYTGGIRYSAGIIQDQVERYKQGNEDSISALHELKQLAVDTKRALLMGNILEIGALLDLGWKQKKRLSARMSNPLIDEMYEEAKKAGAIGGKLLGAGGGGYLAIICPFNRRHKVVDSMSKMGGRVEPWKLEPNGLQTWEVYGWPH